MNNNNNNINNNNNNNNIIIDIVTFIFMAIEFIIIVINDHNVELCKDLILFIGPSLFEVINALQIAKNNNENMKSAMNITNIIVLILNIIVLIAVAIFAIEGVIMPVAVEIVLKVIVALFPIKNIINIVYDFIN